MLFTFAKRSLEHGGDAAAIVVAASRALGRRYKGCAAEVIRHSEDGNRVTIDLSIAPNVESVECFEWFTQRLADESLTLVRDHHFDDAMRRIRVAGARNAQIHC